MSESLAIGVDLGATKIASALVTENGRVLVSRQTPTRSEAGPQVVLECIAAEINALLAGVDGPVAGIGIGTPGIVVPSEGIVRNAVNLGWKEVPLVSGVRARLGLDLPVWVQKDTNASALGEFYFGAAHDCRDFVYLSIGSGLGGGIIANGQILTGAHWQSSEFGHLSLDPEGRHCACGLRGCAETLISGPGLLVLFRERLASATSTSTLAGFGELTTAVILSAAQAGDEPALAAFAEMGAQLGIVMAACVAILNPSLFVIGGGLGLAAFDLVAPHSRRTLEQRVTPSSIDALRIIPSSLQSSAVGPSCLVWNNLNSQHTQPVI
jgi:glucokinase